MYKESGLKSEVVDRKRLYELYDNGACHPMFQTSSGASNSVKQLHDHSNRDSRSDGNHSFFTSAECSIQSFSIESESVPRVCFWKFVLLILFIFCNVT